MRSKIEARLENLSGEIDHLHEEKQAIAYRMSEIQVRMHQLVGAIHELQQLMDDLDRQPSEATSVIEVDPILQEAQFSTMNRDREQDQSTHPSESVDQDIHQELPVETEKNSQPQS